MRKYNNKISERANENLNKRAVVVHSQKLLLAAAVLFLISLGILLCTSINVFANSKNDPSSYHKYYKNIRIEAGDTLWDIADEYICDLNIDKREYIREICLLNNICADDIHAGDYIIVSYYSQDIK